MERGVTALLLSLVQPGLGQLYNRQVQKAFLCFAFLPALIVVVSLFGFLHTFRGFVFWLAVSFLFQIGVAIEAGVVAFREKSGSLARVNAWAIATFTVLALIHITLAASGFYTSRLLALRAFIMRSNSMSPTLVDGDRIVADMNAYSGSTPKRGDIVVFLVPGMPRTLYTKRVAVIGGDTISVGQSGVVVDGRVQADPPMVAQAAEQVNDTFGPATVPENSVFVLGDAITESYDSRYFGSVPLKAIRGRVLFIYYSRNHSRIGQDLH